MSKQDQAARIAERIAKDLFTVGGINKRFTHLRAANRNRDTEEFDELGCGWSEACAADLIAKHIRKARTTATSRAVRKERERCVGIVQKECNTDIAWVGRTTVCKNIIDAIRKGKA